MLGMAQLAKWTRPVECKNAGPICEAPFHFVKFLFTHCEPWLGLAGGAADRDPTRNPGGDSPLLHARNLLKRAPLNTWHARCLCLLGVAAAAAAWTRIPKGGRHEQLDTTVLDPPLFADAVALQVPLLQDQPPPPEIDPITGQPVIDPVTGQPVPGRIHMGAAGYPGIILFWRTNLGKAQNVTGVGEGTVQSTPRPGETAPVPAPANLDVVHSQVLRGDKWTVVVGRPMAAQNPEMQAAFARGKTILVAWSIWEGFFKERNGNKYANGVRDKLQLR
jgi:hypothetical protein